MSLKTRSCSKKGQPSKRRKVDEEEPCLYGYEILTILLAWTEQNPSYGNSHLLVCRELCSHLLVRRELCFKGKVRTNRRDVRIENLSWFESFEGGSRYRMCIPAAKNGDLPFLKMVLKGKTSITRTTFTGIYDASIELDNLEMFKWIRRFRKSGQKYLFTSILYHGAVNILRETRDDHEKTKIYPQMDDIHFSAYLEVEKLWPSIAEQWKDNPELPKSCAENGNLELLKHLFSKNASMTYTDIYLGAVSNGEVEVMKWARTTLYKGESIQLQWRPSNLSSLKLFYDHHAPDLEQLPFTTCEADYPMHKWIHETLEGITKKGFFSAILSGNTLDILNKPKRFVFDPKDYVFLCSQLTVDSCKFLIASGFPVTVEFFFEVICHESVEVCKYIYETYPEICLPRWPLGVISNDTVEKWNWLESICPLEDDDDAGLFAIACIDYSSIEGLKWVLPRLTDLWLEECMESCDELEQIRIVYTRYQILPIGFFVEDIDVFGKEDILFVLDIKKHLPNTNFKITWPDDYNFFKENIARVGWTKNLRRDLSDWWSEKTYQLYLENEHLFKPQH